MSDDMEISNLLQPRDIKEKTYREVNFISVNDQNQGQYESGTVTFDTMNSKSHFSVLSDSYITLTGSIDNSTENAKYAIKNSILSLIQGVKVQSSSGSSILNEIQGSTPIVANLKLMLDSALDFRDANELHFSGHDKHISANVMSDQSVVGGASSTLSDGVPTIDPLRNPALANRIVAWTNCSYKVQVGSTAVYRQPFLVYIPLKFIHDWFAQMNFPMNNMPLEITFNIAGVAGFSSMCPFTCPKAAEHISLGDAYIPSNPPVPALEGASTAAAKPLITLGGSVRERGFTTGVRLFLKTVKMHQEDVNKIAALTTKGFTKTVHFNSSVFHRIQLPSSGQTTYSISSQQIGAAFVRPQRVWVLPVERGTLSSEANSFPAVISAKGQYMTNFNLNMGGTAFYDKNINSQYEFYRLLREQMVGEGQSMLWNTPITYTEFLNGINPYCFDVSRSPLVDTNAPVDITLTADFYSKGGANLPDIDLLVIVEKRETHGMHFSTGGTVHTTVQGDVSVTV